jgi:hypothetical protein
LFRVKRELSGSKIAYGKRGKDRMKHGIDVGRGPREGIVVFSFSLLLLLIYLLHHAGWNGPSVALYRRQRWRGSPITLLLQQAGGVPEITERRIASHFYSHDVCFSCV